MANRLFLIDPLDARPSGRRQPFAHRILLRIPLAIVHDAMAEDCRAMVRSDLLMHLASITSSRLS